MNETSHTETGTSDQVGAPRLTRSTDDKVVAGLCGGLGRHFAVDAVVFRIGFVVLALAGGSGLLLYLVGWLLVPDDRSTATGAPYLARDRGRQVLGAVLGGVGILLLLDRIGGPGDGGLMIGLVLVGAGAAVLWTRRTSDVEPPPDGPPGATPVPPPPALPSPTPEAPATSAMPATSMAPATSRPAPPVPPPFPVPPRGRATGGAAKAPCPRSVLVAVTLSLLAIVAGASVLARVSVATGLGVALLMVGGALVVGAWWGRARWLIPLGVMLSGAVFLASAIDVPLRGGVGDPVFRPGVVSELRSPYRLVAGELTVDLSGLDLMGTSRTVVASVGAGALRVIVPDDAAVTVEAHVGVGSIEMLGRSWEGTDLDQRVTSSGREGGGQLILRPRVGLGEVEVLRAPA